MKDALGHGSNSRGGAVGLRTRLSAPKPGLAHAFMRGIKEVVRLANVDLDQAYMNRIARSRGLKR